MKRWRGRGGDSIRRGDEAGSTLIIALFFATIFSLLVVSVISFAEAGLKSSAAFLAQGQSQYSATGATDAAIKSFSTGNPCADYTSPPIDGQQMIVHCDDLRAASALATEPRQALLSLAPASSGEVGIHATSPALRVQGDVFSNSTIDAASGGSTVVAGDVSALGTCSSVSTAPLEHSQPPYLEECLGHPDGAADPVPGADPGYTVPATTVPVLQSVPGCPASPGWLVSLAPGYYDDATPLNALTNGACHNLVVWLQPGLFYFDLGFRGGSTQTTWTVSDSTVHVVGGTPIGWDPKAAPPPAIADPGGCDTTSLNGVEAVMGGRSQLKVTGGRVELCAPASATDQQVAVFGVPAPTGTHTLKPTMVVGTPAGFVNASNALTIGEQDRQPDCTGATSPTTTGDCNAVASLGSATGTSASIEVGGFAPTVPAGSVIESATLRVSHQDDNDLTATGAITVTTPLTGCGTDTNHSNGVIDIPQRAGALFEDHIDLKACGLTDPSALDGFTVTYKATMDSGGTSATDDLDGIWLDVTSVIPTTFKPTQVAGSTGFTNPGNALEIGEQPTPLTSDAVLAAGGSTTGTITLVGYGQPGIQPNSVLTSAVLRVAHSETGQAAAPTVSVAFPGGSCNAPPLSLNSTGLSDDRVSLAGCGLTAGDLASLAVTYTAALAAGGTTATDSLDGMWLELVYQPAPLSLPATTAASTDFTNPPNAEVIDGATADASLDGTTPAATIDLGAYQPQVVLAGADSNSVLASATLEVAHEDDDTSTPAGSPPAVKVELGGSCSGTETLPAHPGSLTTDTSIDLMAACGFTDPSQLAALTVTYSATLGARSATANDKLDGIAVEFTYRPPAPRTATTATSTGSATTAAFASPGNAEVVDGATATAMLTTSTPSASIDLGSFGANVPPLPPGSAIDKVTLRIDHQDDDTTPSATAPPPPPPLEPPPSTSVAATVGGSTCTLAHPQLTAHPGAIGEDTVDLSGCITDLAQLASLQVTYSAALATGSTSATDQLDGIELDLVVRAPSVEPLSGCLSAIPYTGTGTPCALIQTTAAAGQTRFVVDGTVYAPGAALDLSLSQVAWQVATRGLIARTIHLGVSPAPGYTRPVVGIPPEPVLFTTYPAVIQAATTATSSGFRPADTVPTRGTPVDASLTTNAPGATITLGGYDEPPPATTAALDHAVLQVAHQDIGDPTAIAVSVAFTGDTSATGSTCDTATGHQALTLPTHPGAVETDQVDLTSACGLTGTAQLAGLTVTYTATLASGSAATAELDATQIDVLAGPRVQASVSFDGSAASVKEWSISR